MQHLIRQRDRESGDEGGTRCLFYALGTLLVSLFLCSVFLVCHERSRQEQERERARYIAESYATKIEYVVIEAYSSVYVLEGLLRQGRGQIEDFESYSAEVMKLHPNILNVALAPGGVVSRIYPYERNKQAIGHDLLTVENRSREARLARDTGKATLSGPFVLVQGGYAVVVRLPVFLDGTFWGLACATFTFPRVLDPARLEGLGKQGCDYQLSRVHPDTGERVVLLGSSKPLDEPVEASVELPNVRWTLSVAPQGGWRNWGFLYLAFGIATFISLLLACVVGLITDLIGKKKRLERVSERDPLTGLPNRRALSREMERAMAAGRPFALCYMDINGFKEVNDTHGHDCGDQLLMQFSERFREGLPPEGVLSRLGGDEFIAIVYGVENRLEAETLFRETLDAIASVPYRIGSLELRSSVSMGVALYPSEAGSPEELLRKADADMYGHKKKGAPEAPARCLRTSPFPIRAAE